MTVRPLVILAMLVAGCQVEGNASVAENQDELSSSVSATDEPKSDRKLEPLAIPPDDPCLDQRNPNFDPDKCVEADVRIDPYAGNWKVTRVHVNPDGVQAFVTDDNAIVGSTFSITATEIKWTSKASDKFTSDDVCKQPSAGPLSPIVEKEEGSALMDAFKSFAISASAREPLHRFGCVGGGTWGPGNAGAAALFIPVGTKQMVLKWYDGATLLAERSAP
jgi:hypothetical protein